ncbi:MAG TPA: hypothetical protein VHA56_12720 [Mucilaginibacter sp.]|nr:hypothetical protein [Mucilaginibacter sp.]
MTQIKTNALEKWYEYNYLVSSPLQIIPTVSREKVQFIYNQLKSFFGIRYFDLVQVQDKPIHKISWLFSLLANDKSIGCIGALHQIATLIHYSICLDPKLRKELADKKNSPVNLRNFFFELFIYYQLDKYPLDNKKKLTEHTQELEGSMVIGKKELLFECRKAYLPNLSELDVIRRLVTALHAVIQRITKSTPKGLLLTISLKRPVDGTHFNRFEQKIRRFVDDLNNATDAIYGIDYFIEDNYGTFKVIDYDLATMVETKGKALHDILVYVIPSTTLNAEGMVYHQVEIEANFSLLRSRVYRKLEAVLREKKRQHRKSAFINKVIFIDTEMLPEFQMNIFPNGSMYDTTEIERLYRKLNMHEIVCIVRRIFTSEIPLTIADVFFPDDLQREALVIKQLFN